MMVHRTASIGPAAAATSTVAWRVLAAALALLAPAPAIAQAAAGAGAAPAADGMSDSAFVARTRAGIARFHDRAAAIAAGYRRLGPSFPGMGEHWIHPGLIVRRAVTPGEPPVLCYADIDGDVRLIAAAYAFPLARGAPLPPLPGGAHAWHEHDGAVDEETLLLVHPAAAGSAGSGVRLVMTHVWTELDNPDGVFAQNNWRLPFAQAGVVLDGEPDATAAHAMALVTAGPEYYLRLFDALAAPAPRERAAIAALLAGARARVQATIERHGAGRAPAGSPERAPLDARGLAALRTDWAALWAELAQDVGPALATQLQRPFDAARDGRHR